MSHALYIPFPLNVPEGSPLCKGSSACIWEHLFTAAGWQAEERLVKEKAF